MSDYGETDVEQDEEAPPKENYSTAPLPIAKAPGAMPTID